MDKLAFISGESFIYWNSIVYTLAAATAICFFLAFYIGKCGNAVAGFAVVPLSMFLGIIAARFFHWYCQADSYESFLTAMTDYTSGGYALMGVFLGCFLAACLLRLIRLDRSLPEMLDAMAVSGCAGIAVGRAAQGNPWIFRQIADAMAALRGFGVVHRDIKPENVILQPDGTAKLVDLGIAKAVHLEDSLVTLAGAAFGSPIYISPEQVVDASDVDARADIYSLGIVFFEMVTGRCPYAGRNIAQVLREIMSEDPVPDARDVCPDVPAEVAVFIRRMCVKDRARRLQDFNAVLAELEKLAAP